MGINSRFITGLMELCEEWLALAKACGPGTVPRMLNPEIQQRRHWLAHLERLARPVLTTGAAGELPAVMPLATHAEVDPGRVATAALETLGRTLAGIAPWLACPDLTGDELALQQELAELARQALVRGCTPGDSGWLNFDREQQTLVDAAFLAHALLRGRAALWEPLSSDEQQLVVSAFQALRDRKPYRNNWLLFSAITETFLLTVGADGDPMRIDYALAQHEQWYLGDGTYGDGHDYHADYYNSFVIQPMLVDILDAVGERFGEWHGNQEQVLARFRRQAAIQERMINRDGTWPVLGRSIVYRCGAFQVLAQAALQQRLPAELSPAQVRGALSAAIERSLAPAACWRDDGWLQIGLAGHQPGLGERYITTGSLYLCSFAFLPLGLPPGSAFWSDQAQPWTAVKAWDHVADLPADHALY